MLFYDVTSINGSERDVYFHLWKWCLETDVNKRCQLCRHTFFFAEFNQDLVLRY